MTSMKDYIKVEVTGDVDAVTSELFVENTIENPAWYTVEDNHVSLVSENVEKVIKFETDMLDDCMWESKIEITQDVANQSNMELPLECQEVADNIYVNHGNTSDKIFNCNICGKSFVLNYLLKNHLAEHKRQVNNKTNKCKFCGKQFKLKFGLNRHIQKHHNSMVKCKLCRLFIDCSKYIEHKKYHERRDQTKLDTIPNIKLCKLNGVWKSKTNEFKCNICFQKCYSEKNLVEHMETHDNCQTQCNDCLDYVSVSEMNDHMENIHNKHLFKCQKCNQQFQKQIHLNCHLIHCLRSSHTKSNKVCGKIKANEKTCSACGIVFNNSLSLKNHTTIGCKHYTCKYCGQFFSKRNLWLKHTDVHKKVEQCAMLKVRSDGTSTIREYNQTEVVNDSSFNTNVRQFLSRDITGRNSSDHTRLVNSNSTIVSTDPHDSMPNNYIIPNSGKTNILERNSSDPVCLINSNATIVSSDPHNSMPNNYIIPNAEQTNILERNSSDPVCLVNSNATIVSTASHTYIPNNDIISNPGQTKILSNTLEKNSSTQIEHQLEESNLIPESVPSDIFYNRTVNIKQEQYCHTTASDNIQPQINIQQSSASIALHNSIANNNSPVLSIKQETNNSNQINLTNSNESIVSTVSQNSMANNCHIPNIKQEKNLSTNMRERNSTNQVDSVNSNKSTLANKPRDLMAEQNPVNIANNNIVPTVRETPYFCIRKLPNIKNGFCNDDNDQTSQNNVIFICRICKNSPSTDIHSFALHMSDHSECNMHECIVCDKTFNSVVLWTDHMTYHQQQIDLNVSKIQFKPIETESNALDPINSRNMEPQVRTKLRNRKFNISLLDDSHSDMTRLNSVSKIKYHYDCGTCKKVFPSKSTLKVHQTLHNKSQSFSCRYCDKIFSGKGPCTNHEKSHINSNNLLLQNNENIKLEPIVIQNSISIEDNNSDSETMSRKQKQNISSSIKETNFCNFCNRKFTKRCYFTNHMMMKHKININTPNQLTLVNCNKSVILSENIELTNEHENKSSAPVNNKLNNHVNKSNEKKSTFCMICNTHFAHLGALTNHMRIHSYKTYKCQYCYMQFSRKGLYILHEKTHVLNNEVKSSPSQNKNNIVVEVNDEPQVEHYNSFEIIHTPVDGNSSGKNLIDIEPLWFPCDVCEKKFSTPFQLNVHRKSHSGILPYVCKICNRTYQLKFRWNWHLKCHYKKHITNLKSKQHTNNLKSNITKLKIESISHKDKMKCRYCKKEYNSISQWKKHMTMSKECRRHCKSNLPEFTSNNTTKNSSKSSRFRCNICMKTYSTSYNRTVHKKNVHNVLDTTYLNTYDNTVLQKDKSMNIIQQKPAIKKRNRHNHINGTKCEFCGKMYSNGANLSRHISIIHTQTYEPMTCDVCGSTFKHKFSYREHLKTKHKQLFKLYNETNSTYKRTSQQIISVNKTNVLKYFCKICKMKFADNITLQEHSMIHTLNMYKCKDCGQQFETNLTLGNHILENHSANISTSIKNEHVENYERQNASLEIINNNFAQCEICLKILKTPKYLRIHMRLHTGVKPFKCDKCNKAFRFKSNLKVHQKKDLACYTP